MINGHETMTCTGNHACAMKFVTFYMLCNVVSSNYNILGLCNGHIVHFVFMLLPGKSESIYCSIRNAVRYLCKRHNQTHEYHHSHIIDFEIVMHTVLNAC